MTINISVLTRKVIYQAADLRLTDASSGDVVTEVSTKIVNVTFFEWSGFVTYTGVGRWDGKDTALWVCDWIRGVERATPEQLAEVIRKSGDAWLEDINRRKGVRFHHTFVFSVFHADAPVTYVISNFEAATGKVSKVPSDALRITRASLRTGARVIVTGKKKSVTRSQRRALARLASRYPDGELQVRRLLKETVFEAHRSPHSKGTVGPDCTVVSFRGDGSGVLEATGQGLVQVHSVMNGLVLGEGLDLAGIAGPNARVKAVSFSSSRGAFETPICDLELEEPGGLRVDALMSEHFATSRAMAVNESGQVLGLGTYQGSPADYHMCIWSSSGSVTDLGLICRNNLGCALNDGGLVAATVAAVENTNRAVLWEAGDVIDLGVHLGVDSGVRCINAAGVVGGWVCIDESARGQINFRPAQWDENQRISVLEQLPADWGQTVDLDETGTALVRGYRERTPVSLIWKPDGRCIEVAEGLYPERFLPDGSVLGWTRNTSGQRLIAAVARDGSSLIYNHIPPDWHLGACNETGAIVGFVQIDGYERAWIFEGSPQPKMLPGFYHHHCRPIDVNGSGLIVGVSRSDRM